jgi:epoxyqueuosine reductase
MPSLPELMALDDEGFRRRFGKSAIKRTKRRGLLRNATIVLGNSGNPAAIPVLARTLGQEPEPLVRAHSAWALGRLGGSHSRRALEQIRKRETDGTVKNEIESALAAMTC